MRKICWWRKILSNIQSMKNLFLGDDNDPLVRSSPNLNHFSNKKNEMLLAKVSLTIVFIFILCHSVKWIPNIFELLRVTFMEDKRAWPTWVEAVTHISHFLTTFNSSVNFYVYCFKHFNVITSCCIKSDQHIELYSQNSSHCNRRRHQYDKDLVQTDDTREIIASEQVWKKRNPNKFLFAQQKSAKTEQFFMNKEGQNMINDFFSQFKTRDWCNLDPFSNCSQSLFITFFNVKMKMQWILWTAFSRLNNKKMQFKTQ